MYHTQRGAFLDGLNRLISFLVILLGASVVSKVANGTWLELGVVFFATIQLVFDFGTRAMEHQFLQRRYYEILAQMDMDAESAADPEAAKKWSAKLLTIAADEPMPMRALDAIAYNQALDAMHDDAETQQQFRQQVTTWQYLLRNFCAFQHTNFYAKTKT